MKNEDYQQMKENWKQIISYGPRPFGSASLKQCSDYLTKEMKKLTPDAYQESYGAEAWEVENWNLLKYLAFIQQTAISVLNNSLKT